MPRIVVLGTGTGVGKTYFTERLARALAGPRGKHPVLALKPVETGLPAPRRGGPPSDAQRLGRASSRRGPDVHPLFRFPDPVSPHLAARRRRQAVSLQAITRWAATAEHNANTLRDTALPWILIETAGAALSPLTPQASNVDLATALGPSIWILVAPDALGVLHDVRVTLLALRQLARPPDFLVLSAARERDASTGTNAGELARLGIAEPIAVLPRGGTSSRPLARLVAALRRRGV